MKKYLIISIIFLLPFLFFSLETEAGSEHNVSGWAWAENFGWISMNSTNHSGSVNYGVHIGEDYNLTGYAWNNYTDGGIGWIDFDPVSGFPESPSNSVTLDPDTGDITGWARAISYGGGWDGWIKMYDTALVGGEITGWGWGGNVVGWISFNCLNEAECGVSDYQVEADFAAKPVINTPAIDSDYDIGLRKKGAIYLYWTYDAGNTESVVSYDLQIATDTAFNNLVVDRSEIPQVLLPGEQGSSVVYVSHPGHPTELNELPYNDTYYWRVRVNPSVGVPSDWLTITELPDPIVEAEPWPWPYAQMDWSPVNPLPGEQVTFDATGSETFKDPDNPGDPCLYCWEFDGYDGDNICFTDPSNPSEVRCTQEYFNEFTGEMELYCTSRISYISLKNPDFNLTEARVRVYDCETGDQVNPELWGTLVLPVTESLPQPTWREVSPY